MSLPSQLCRRRTFGRIHHLVGAAAPLAVALLTSSSTFFPQAVAAFAPPLQVISRPISSSSSSAPVSSFIAATTTLDPPLSFTLQSPLSSLSSSYSTTRRRYYHRNHFTALSAKPKRGSVVDSYRTVGVVCSKCRNELFRYKKKNGTKSNLVKCYIERIAEDKTGLLNQYNNNNKNNNENTQEDSFQWNCPNCQSNFARARTIHGRPALKLVGGKVRMTK